MLVSTRALHTIAVTPNVQSRNIREINAILCVITSATLSWYGDSVYRLEDWLEGGDALHAPILLPGDAYQGWTSNIGNVRLRDDLLWSLRYPFTPV